MENQKALLDSIGSKLGATSSDLSPWYKADFSLLRKHGAIGLVTKTYNSSLYLMLKSVYPEHDWVPWQFKVLPASASRDPEVIRKALDFVEKTKAIAKPEEWYN